MKFPFEIIPFCKQLSFPYFAKGFVFNNEHIGIPIPIPLPVIRDKIYSPSRYLHGLYFYYKNRGSRSSITPDEVYIGEPYNLFLYFHYLDVLATELSIWKQFYLPPSPNQIIIDVGAGCGESAWLYYRYAHPKQVISIEPDKDRFKLLEINSKSNRWPNHILINDILRPEHFTTDYLGLGKCTFAKIDIEGAEKDFIDYPFPNMIMETHLSNTKLYTDNGFRKVWDNHRGCALVTNLPP